MNDNKEEVWLFDFVVESESGDDIDRKVADELMDVIIQWAENNGCQIGGGYRAPEKGERDSDQIFNYRKDK